MADQESRRVFISYAHRDGAELAARLQQDLSHNGFDAWLDTQRIAGGAVWTLTIEEEIDSRDITVALLTPASYRSHVCRAEQLRALRKGKRLIPVLAANDADIPLHIEPFQYRNFSDRDCYQTSLRELLGDILGNTTATLREAFRETRVSYVTAPPLVANYVERPEAVLALRDSLFAEDHRGPIALTALAGMGGIGKTVLAQALIRDGVVRQAFPDGIVWITVGREKQQNFVQQMRELAKALGDDLSRYDNPVACQNQYKTTIANKAALIVVDDVWSKTDIDPLLAESPRSRFLFTTRDASIARFVGAHEHRAELLDVVESRELLAGWTGLPVGQIPPEADTIIRECGRLPLALAQIGALLRGTTRSFWMTTLDMLRSVDLTSIQNQLPPGQDSFFRSVEVSFLALTPKMRENYKTLAVLLEDMSAPLPILQTLWHATDAEARRISKHFVDRSLAQWNTDQESVRLHDLQLDYIRAQYPEPEALKVIHDAVRLSYHVIDRDPRQFASQLVGRLLPCVQAERPIPPVQEFTRSIIGGAPRPWLQPLQPALTPPGMGLVRTLTGHSNVICVGLSADGRRAVSGSGDGTLKIWDLEDNRERTMVESRGGWINDLAVSADGRRAVSASDAGTDVWDLESGRRVHHLTSHSYSVGAVALSADGRRAVSASLYTLKVWDLESGHELRTWDGHSAPISGLAMSANGRHAVSASRDHTLKAWDLESGRELNTLRGHSGVVRSVAIRPDGRRAVSASEDHTLQVWDLESGRKLLTLEGHSAAVHDVAVSADGRRAVSVSFNRTLKVWNLEAHREVRTLKGHSAEVRCVSASADGRRAISISDTTLKVWDADRGGELRTLGENFGGFNGVVMRADGRCAVSTSGSRLKVWDLETGRELRTLEGHSESVKGLAVSADWARAVSASQDRTLKVWDLESGSELHSQWGCAPVAVNGDGRRVVFTSSDVKLVVLDLESAANCCTLEGHSAAVCGVAVSSDGQRAVSASWDKTLKVWDLKNGRELRTLKGHSDGVHGVAVSPDGRYAVSASWDHTLVAWDLGTGALMATFTCDAPVRCCAISASRKIIGGDEAGLVHILSLELKGDN